MRVQATLDRAPEIAPGEELNIHLILRSKLCFEDEARNVLMSWFLPEGFTVKGKKSLMLHGFNPHSDGSATADFTITAGENVLAENRIVLEILTMGRATPLYISIPIFG